MKSKLFAIVASGLLSTFAVTCYGVNAQADAIYDVNLTVGSGTLTGTITTDGNTG
jgi:hypothetical protein